MPRLLTLLLLLPLAACAGGSSPTELGAPSAVEVEQHSFDLANGERIAAAEATLTLSAELTAVARGYSTQMRDENFFGHHSPDGLDLAARLHEAGIPYHAAAENLARMTNVPDPARWAHDQLMASEEHRQNILDEGYRLGGVGVAESGGTYWLTQIFLQP